MCYSKRDIDKIIELMINEKTSYNSKMIIADIYWYAVYFIFLFQIYWYIQFKIIYEQICKST